MRASEFISLMKEMIEQHGDIEVKTIPYGHSFPRAASVELDYKADGQKYILVEDGEL